MAHHLTTVRSESNDSIAAIVPTERLSDVLSLLHRSGFGHNTRVVHPDRGDMQNRLRRAGLSGDSRFIQQPPSSPVVLVVTHGRLEAAGQLLEQSGARQLESFTTPSGTPSALLNFDVAQLGRPRNERRTNSPH